MKLFRLYIILFLLISFSPISAQFVSDVKKTEMTVRNDRAKIYFQLLNRAHNPQIIDIRTPQEYASGHLKGAVLINYYRPDFVRNIKKAGFDKLRPIFIYCRSGHRSARAIPIFEKLGFRHIVNMVYGINEWNHLHLPIEKGLPKKINKNTLKIYNYEKNIMD